MRGTIDNERAFLRRAVERHGPHYVHHLRTKGFSSEWFLHQWAALTEIANRHGFGPRVLDLGCGPGWSSIFLAGRGFRVTAGDVAPDMLALARENAERFGVADAIDFRELDMQGPLGPGGSHPALLTDFGVAKLIDSPRRTRATKIIGTPDYLAPEIVEGLPPRASVDIYALATVLYELLAGFTPFGGGHPGAVLRRHVTETVVPLPGIPDELWQLIVQCLAKAPASRLRASELGVRLPTLQDGQRRIAAALGVPNVMPATVILRADGSVAQILLQAFTSADEIAAAVKNALQ